MRGDCISDNEGINLRDAEERMIYQNSYEKSLYDGEGFVKRSDQVYSVGHPSIDKTPQLFKAPQAAVRAQDAQGRKSVSTYLNGLQPHELARLAEPQTNEREYRAEYGNSGEAFLVLTSKAVIAKFDTFADAQLAAEALNNHKGY